MIKEVIGGIKNVFNKASPEDYVSIGNEDPVPKRTIISFIDSELEKRKNERIALELQWTLNNNFLNGNQYCDINMQSYTVEEIPKAYWWEHRAVYNHLAPIYETRLAKLGRVNPSLKTRPATNERRDISTAKICTSLIKGSYRQLKMHKKIKTATAWSEICGTVFYKTIWDKSKGRVIGDLESEIIKEGNKDTIIVPPYEVYPDKHSAEDIENIKSFMHVKAYTVSEIEEIWGIKLKGKEVDIFSLTQSNASVGGLGYRTNVQKITTSKMKDSELVIEYYERPTKKYPTGRLIIKAGNELLYYGELPYECEDDGERGIPFDRQVCVEKVGSFWGESIITRLIPVQRDYNAVRNKKREYLNRCVIQPLIYEENSINDDVIGEDGIAPGDMIPVKKGTSFMPKYLENGRLPPELLEEESKLIHEFESISGVSELALKSGVPTGTGSGVALEILQEQDDTRLSLSAENIRNTTIEVGKRWLRFDKQFAMGKRLLSYVGNDNSVQVFDWEASDITTYDVVLETENELAQSPAQRKQMVIDLLQMGVFNDSQTGRLDARKQAKIIEMLELGNWDSGNDITELHITRANRENMSMEKMQIPRIKDFDDHVIHILEHNKYRLSADYEELEASNPQVALIFDLHVKQHTQYINQQLQQQAMSQIAQQSNTN